MPEYVTREEFLDLKGDVKALIQEVRANSTFQIQVKAQVDTLVDLGKVSAGALSLLAVMYGLGLHVP